MTKLSNATLSSLRPGVSVPAYKATDLSPGILHFGLGNFHRAHQAVYLDRLFNQGKSRDWAIIGTGVRPADRAMHNALKAQDWLTTVVEQEANVSRARVTGSMVDFIPPEERAAIVARLADPAIRIISITVTEGGYFIDPATGSFNPELPEIAQDGKAPEDPRTVFGLIALGLKQRRDAGVKPFTVMSCDNIPHNGVVARNAVAGLARLYDKGLAQWIEETASFPNGMVDRITPATTDRERQLLSQDFGIEDRWPVYCEAFIQWVLEDEFCNGRPALEEAGVQFVSDVTPFEFMKIRILNGGHAAIAYPASLLDIHFVHDAMNHPLVSAFFAKIEREEIMPTVPPVPGVVLEDYYHLIHRRFANPKIGDTIPRLAFDGSNRQPKFIVPVARDRLKAGASVDALAFESALWCRHCAGKTETGKDITAGDPNWPRLTALAQQTKADPLVWLSMEDVYGDVGQAPLFRQAFARSLSTIWGKGTARALADFVGAESSY
jgi:mannitol 2-dehydrogenase